jgi:Flp pilus assembly protein TadD
MRLTQDKGLKRITSIAIGIFLLAIFSPVLASGQIPRKISGQLRGPDGTPLEYVVVELEMYGGVGILAATTTDALGKFSFEGLSQAPFQIRIRVFPYEEITQHVDLRFSNFSMNWELKPPGGMKTITLYEPPIEAVDHLEDGRQFMELGDSEAALHEFETALRIHERYPDAYFWRATALMDQGKYVEAEAALEKVLELHPLYGMGFLALGTCRNRMGKPKEAIDPLLEVILVSPGSVEAHYELARAYYALEKLEKAEESARKALELNVTYAAGHVLLGNILLRKKDFRSALEEFRQYMRLEPGGPMAASVTGIIGKIEQEIRN